MLPCMSTTVVHPRDRSLEDALRLAALFAAIKLVIHIAANAWQAHLGWGYFRDEFYYIACGRHIAWGYVDHGPLVALQARLSIALFGKSLVGIRMLSALAGAGRVFVTGLLAWALGGRRPAQGLAMIGVLIAPQYLGTDSYLSMNSFESLFWMTSLLAVILMLRGAGERLWLLFGVSAGVGLLNKPSMTFFLVALLAALLLTPQRRLLFSQWAIIGVAVMILIALPNLLWQIHHHWPTLEFLMNGRIENKNVKLAPLPFIAAQIKNLQPLSILIWGIGLVWLLRRKNRRWLGLTYLLFLAIMMALHAKDYYVAPVYPFLYAAGGIAWENHYARSKRVLQNRFFAFPILETVLLVCAVILLPLSFPVSSPRAWLTYTKTMHLYNPNANSENSPSGPLPQFYADRFGWQEEVDQITRVYQSLSLADKAKVGITCSNYGEAGAINFLGHGLPVAVSGQNNYWLWGPQRYTGQVIIAVSGNTPEEMRETYDSVEIVGRMDHPFSMSFEHRNIYLVRGRHKNLTSDWDTFKHYI